MLLIDPIPADMHRPLRRVEYDRLVDLGVFDGEPRIELVRGRLVRMSPMGDRHAFAVENLTELLVTALVGRARVRAQLPFAASDDSEPEPDLAVRRIGERTHPTSLFLVIEVADSSLAFDRDVKGPLYAENGVPEYWLVNIAEGVVEVYRDPAHDRYSNLTTVSRGGKLRLLAFPDVELAVDDIFG